MLDWHYPLCQKLKTSITKAVTCLLVEEALDITSRYIHILQTVLFPQEGNCKLTEKF
ncbi:hypothetical protein Nmel_002726 [Mimus melanotis]